MGCGLGHSPAAAGATESAFLTREGDELFVLAVLAPEPQKAVGQNPALEEGLELLGDVLWDELALRLCKSLEGAVVSGDALVEDCLITPPLVVLSADCLEAELAHGGAALQGLCQAVAFDFTGRNREGSVSLSLRGRGHIRALGAVSVVPERLIFRVVPSAPNPARRRRSSESRKSRNAGRR